MQRSATSTVRATASGAAANAATISGIGPQVPLGVREQGVARGGDGRAVADGGEHVVQRQPSGRVIVDVVGGDERQAGLAGEVLQLFQSPGVVRPAEEFGEEVGAIAEDVAKLI